PWPRTRLSAWPRPSRAGSPPRPACRPTRRAPARRSSASPGERPPRHILEESSVAALTARDGAPPPIFSLVTAGGVSALGSTFGEREPDPAALLPALRERGARFLPAAGAAV